MSAVITAKEAAALGIATAPKSHKYRAERFSLDGIKFDSKAEASDWARLKLLERAGEIRDLQRQVDYLYEINGVRMFVYRADFTYLDRADRRHVVDRKGYDTPVSKLKRKIIEAHYGIVIEVVR